MKQYTFETYINYILTTLINEDNGYNHWWMFLIFPAVFYTIFLVFKYLLLTMPFWIVFQVISNVFNKNKQ